MTIQQHKSSFRDPSGFLFYRKGKLYRQINKFYLDDYELLKKSGLYQALRVRELLIAHREVDVPFCDPSCGYKIIEPEMIPFISYPYEWSFSMLKDAALLTLEIQKIAIKHGMILKDSSAYNVQFYKGKAIFIDSLSFEKYNTGMPWHGYRQFCQHFLAPLALAAYRDIRSLLMLKIHIDGIPLDFTSTLLPFRAKLKLGIFVHICLHARSQRAYSEKMIDAKKAISQFSLLGIIDNLESTVRKLRWSSPATEWKNYYQAGLNNYTSASMQYKMKTIEQFLDFIPQIDSCWDIGGNTGRFSSLASQRGINTVCFDIDPAAIELCYIDNKQKQDKNLLALIMDFTNPSSGIGWDNCERSSLFDRGQACLIMALALIHHLAISNNIPLLSIAQSFANNCMNLIIEFIPKSDSQVKILLGTRKDIFPDYKQLAFEEIFGKFFEIIKQAPVRDTERVLYLMKNKKQQK